MTKIAASEKRPTAGPNSGSTFWWIPAPAHAHCGSPGRYFARARCSKSARDAALSRPLLARRARRLIAIEIDRVLAAQLRMNFSQEPNVEIIEGDVLAIDFHTLFGPKPGSNASRD